MMQKRQNRPLTVIPDLIRNLLGIRDSLQQRKWRILVRHDGKGYNVS